MSKRSRSFNWDEKEKQLFLSVLKDYAKIIEDKTLNTNTNKLKSKAWEEVHQKFNSLNSRERDMNQLKIQWKGMKINARKKYGTFKREINKTGGGTRPATPEDADAEVKDLLNPAELLVDHNIYDSDGMVFIPESTKEETLLLFSANANETIQIALDTISVTPVKKYLGPPSAKTRKLNESKIQKITTKAVSKSRKDHDYVSSILSYSKKLKEEEHMQRIKMADEEHAIKMAIHQEKLRVIP